MSADLKLALAIGARIAAVALLLLALAETLRSHEPRCLNCNVILVSADTLRADHLGCYGYGRDTSPAIDTLARQGILFERAYSASAWTLPGHMTMLTGRYPVQESEFVFMSAKPFPDSYRTLPQVLKQAGYATVGFPGGGLVGGDLGFARGFDRYQMFSDHLDGNRQAIRDWLDSRDPRQPFFVFLHGYDVHEPYKPPAARQLRFIDEVPPECRGVDLKGNEGDLACRQSPRGREYLVSQYDAEILGVDGAIKWLVAELQRRGLWERTLLVFTADHGEALMEQGELGCGHMGDLDETVFRVPVIMHLPRAEPRRVQPRVSLVDLTPTILDLVGIPAADTMHGRSLVPLLEGRAEERQINGLTGNDPGNFVLGSIAGHTKLVKRRFNRGSPWTYELYDLAADPWALNNLLPPAGPPPPGFSAMLQDMERWIREVGIQVESDDEPPLQDLPPAVRDQLEALGYR